jgi:peptidoglycan/xylan/chitin deacetylase (PgdA/CDA1 family)
MSSGPARRRAALPAACCLTIDVEEWYHTCLIPELVDPARRPAGLVEELDWLLPEVLGVLAEHGRQATFFVLGEVAARHPARVREIAAAGHEVASHSRLHLRAHERSAEAWRADLEGSRRLLEDLVGQPVLGFRAPEWSLRSIENPQLRTVAEAGYRYDSSLAPFLGAGCRVNPCEAEVLRWPEGLELLELPPLVWGGPLRLPAGSWPGRLAPAAWTARLFRRALGAGRCAVAVTHPWELSPRPTPGHLGGFAGFVHETGRRGFRRKFEHLLAALPWRAVRAALDLG